MGATTEGLDLTLICERCGYMLQGLVPQQCPACSLFRLRCPECGHQQHANSACPALLRFLGRLRGVALIIGALLMVGFCALACFIWWLAGMEWANAVHNGRVISDADYWVLALGAVLSTWSLHGILAHARRRLVTMLVVLVCHALAFCVGSQRLWINFGGPPQSAMPLVPQDFVLYVLPWFVLGVMSAWVVLRLFYFAFWPARVQRLLVAWACHGRMPRINVGNIQLPGRLSFGDDGPRFCDGCGRALLARDVEVCPECTLMHVHCSTCGDVQAVSPLRPVLGEVAARTMAVTLHLCSLLFAGILLLALFGWLIGGHECAYSYRYVPVSSLRTNQPGVPVQSGNYAGPFPLQWNSEDAVFAAWWALVFGVVARTMMLRWRSGLIVGLVAGAVTVGAFAFGMTMRAYSRPEAISPFSAGSALVLLMIVGGVTVGSLITWPGWWLFAKVMLPRAVGERLLHWLAMGSIAELIVLSVEEPQRSEEPADVPG